jgi:hypothetical protein
MELAADLFQEEVYRLAPRVVVIIDMPWRDVKEAERQLLAKILGAIEIAPQTKLSLQAVQIVIQPELNLATLPFQPQQVIAFTRVPKGIPQLEVVTAGSCQVVAAPRLPELITQDDAKKRLWTALRAQFGMGAKGA